MQFDHHKFILAAEDYLYLLERHYPDKGVLKWVGDRYGLSSLERTLLYRGITTRDQSVRFGERIVEEPDELLIIDGYNVLFTLMNYRLGNPVFICTDQLCRDAGSQFGKIANTKIFNECCSSLITHIGRLKTDQIILYLDEPVKNSSNHRMILQDLALRLCPYCQIHCAGSADQTILVHTSGTLATSDSGILNRTDNLIIDLPRRIIEQNYKGNILDLNSII